MNEPIRLNNEALRLQARRRLAISVIVFICIVLVVLMIAGLGASLGYDLYWTRIFAWTLPIAAAIAVAVHLVNYVEDTGDLINGDSATPED